MSRFYLAWIKPDGVRDHSTGTFSTNVIRNLAQQLSEGPRLPDRFFAVPADKIEAWKAGA